MPLHYARRPSALLGLTVGVILVGLFMGCAEDDDTVTDPSASGRQEFTIPLPDRRSSGDHVPGSRKAEHDAAVTEILSNLPTEADRAKMRELLSSTNSRISSTTNARQAELLRQVYAIRDADAKAQVAAQSREMARQRGVVVTVALVETLSPPNAKAVVVRSATGETKNQILLRKNVATADDLYDAVSLFFGLRGKHGDVFLGEMRVTVPNRAAARDEGEQRLMRRRFNRLRGAPTQEIAGLGLVQAIGLKLGPVVGQ